MAPEHISITQALHSHFRDSLERFGEYFRFLPRWRYLRYDRNPPPLALALVPRNRTLPNPFYYHSGTAEEESYATYRILLRRMADSGAQIVLLLQFVYFPLPLYYKTFSNR